MMQKTDANKTAQASHRQVRASTTLNRRYVKRPMKSTDVAVTIKRSPKVQHFNPLVSSASQPQVRIISPTTQQSQTIESAKRHPLQDIADDRMRIRKSQIDSKTGLLTPMSAKEIKDREIKKALAVASRESEQIQEVEQIKTKKVSKMHFGFGRVALALSCAAVAVFAIVYFVNLNMPDISLRVAAMQTGIEASYPNYVPRDYSLTDIASENGKITLNFYNRSANTHFALVEEKSSWDSNALLTNFVKENYSESYTAVREQGLTIYIDGSSAAWVNGGVFYKISAFDNTLTKKQIKSIATSL